MSICNTMQCTAQEATKQNVRVRNNLIDLNVKIKGNEKYGLYSI